MIRGLWKTIAVNLLTLNPCVSLDPAAAPGRGPAERHRWVQAKPRGLCVGSRIIIVAGTRPPAREQKNRLNKV